MTGLRSEKAISATPYAIECAKRRRAQAIEQQQKDELADAARVARWLGTRALKPASGPTAETRLDRLRARLRARGGQGQ